MYFGQNPTAIGAAADGGDGGDGFSEQGWDETQPVRESPRRSRRAHNTEIITNYKIWKQCSPYFYDYMMTQCLLTTSYTFQWLPTPAQRVTDAVRDVAVSESSINVPKHDSEMTYSVQEGLLGTSYDSASPLSSASNGVLKAKFMIEDDSYVRLQDVARYRTFNQANATIPGSGGGINSSLSKMTVRYVAKCKDSISLIRYMPQNPKIILARTQKKEIPIFELSSDDDNKNECVETPTAYLIGHTLDGYGACFHPSVTGQVAGCSRDRSVIVWDINSSIRRKWTEDFTMHTSNNTSYIEPTARFFNHSIAVCDVKINPLCASVLGSVGADGRLAIQDVRDRDYAHVTVAHAFCANALDFSPFNEYVVATGSNDCTVGVWDLRNLSNALVRLRGHADDVLQVKWSPHIPCILMSSSVDRTVNLWNLGSNSPDNSPYQQQFQQQQRRQKNLGGQTEEQRAILKFSRHLMFVHGGHTARVNDTDFNPNMEFLVASTCAANILQIWRISDHLFGKSLIDTYGDQFPCVMDLPKAAPMIGTPGISHQKSTQVHQKQPVQPSTPPIVSPTRRGFHLVPIQASTPKASTSTTGRSQIPQSALKRRRQGENTERVKKSVSFRLEVPREGTEQSETHKIVRPGDASPISNAPPGTLVDEEYDDSVFRSEFGGEIRTEERNDTSEDVQEGFAEKEQSEDTPRPVFTAEEEQQMLLTLSEIETDLKMEPTDGTGSDSKTDTKKDDAV
ncbi:hypothetical protein ACOME3_009874 [Neoechinorhynchus agilis]